MHELFGIPPLYHESLLTDIQLQGYKGLFKRLRLKCDLNKESIEGTKLNKYRLFISAGPRKPFSGSEIEAIRNLVFESTKSVFILFGETRDIFVDGWSVG